MVCDSRKKGLVCRKGRHYFVFLYTPDSVDELRKAIEQLADVSAKNGDFKFSYCDSADLQLKIEAAKLAHKSNYELLEILAKAVSSNDLYLVEVLREAISAKITNLTDTDELLLDKIIALLEKIDQADFGLTRQSLRLKKLGKKYKALTECLLRKMNEAAFGGMDLRY